MFNYFLPGRPLLGIHLDRPTFYLTTIDVMESFTFDFILDIILIRNNIKGTDQKYQIEVQDLNLTHSN